MKPLSKPILIAAMIAFVPSSAFSKEYDAMEAPTVGGSILGVKVNVTAVKATGFRASKLIGAAVYNDKNKEIGSVNDLILSSSGKVNLAIIDVGGFLGIGAKHVAIPAHLFKRGKKEAVLLPGATKTELKAMPPFTYAN